MGRLTFIIPSMKMGMRVVSQKRCPPFASELYQQISGVVSDRPSYLITRNGWCDVVLNVHKQQLRAYDGIKTAFMENLSMCFTSSFKYHM